MSTLLLIPWIIFGFKKRGTTFLGLTQTKKSVILLLCIEVILWTALMLVLEKPDSNIAGQGSFAWMYFWIYEKGIFPTAFFAERIDGTLGDRIDSHYQFVYLIVALLVDYVILFLVSPRPKQLLTTNKYYS